MGKTVTYLEMTDHRDLKPGRSVPALELRREEGLSELARSVAARVGAAYGWRSSTRSDQEWQELARAHPHCQYWLIRMAGETAGIVALEPQPGGDVEIRTFGLLPEHVGQGLGGHALTLAVEQAWATRPLEAESVRRVYLHTNSNDHPSALLNYRSRGLRVYRTEVDGR
ncbi:GNAT family N-acetyltransferase [Streptomyces beijiangensis]|uniref:GNAT family N-acetyltransferase n=1 Tax=Streptomyces beijiangensis TaxID=163361 RepID=A0A939FBN2_9ACTN|nr:GNAT family N-acetyltransferase [Streptomyces beijiangensis]MBO0515276.1 GNAT family N-acetyltransferase [Streptomyces beijiangensis]